MSLFFQSDTPAKLVNVNVRAEGNGNDLRNAVDLRFRLSVSNTVLNRLAPGLLEALYEPGEARAIPDKKGQLSHPLPVSEIPKLRFPRIAAPLKWDDEFPIAGLVVHMTGHAAVSLGAARVTRFEIEPHEGGSVVIAFTVQSMSEPDADAMGRLCVMTQRDVGVRFLADEALQESASDV